MKLIICHVWKGKIFIIKNEIIIALLLVAGLLLTDWKQVKAARRDELILKVPFTSQAPLGEWRDTRQQDGCEEAAVAMVMAWVGGEKNISKKDWRLRILILSDFEYKKYGEYRDVALHDMVAWLFNDYFNYWQVRVKTISKVSDIVRELEAGRVVLIPLDGRTLKNPNFTGAGPERHIILIKGYNYQTKKFITNDPGTRNGENYRYSEKVIFNAVRNYKTGHKLPFGSLKKEMIVVGKYINK